MTHPPGSSPQGQSQQQLDHEQPPAWTPPPRAKQGIVGWVLGAGGSMLKRVVVTLIALGLLAGGTFLWKHMTGAASTAAPGDCVQQTGGTKEGTQDFKVVDCTDSKASYRVLGKLDHRTEPSDASTSCDPWPATTAAFWEQTTRTGDGYILCLGDVHS
ncbi:hypothetical protein ACFVXG_00460 [Kitasatospora sp. NPDC058162]|uniref:LppU/SCO3897 family protein n=1 Tax=Kitasatospora sp. NPDC058162 TaxID=3346362 RepID=UPI0036D9EDAD